MFLNEKEGKWEPNKVRRKPRANGTNGISDATNGEDEEEAEYEEDLVSDEGAVWPITEGRITNWTCFLALMQHVFNLMNPPFHTPILLIGQPCWTVRDHERVTQFFFEKFRMPAFALMDAATATAYAYGVANATVIDVGFGKADITAVSDFVVHETGRAIAVPNCGGEAMTQRLLDLLGAKKFTRQMCEQLKRSAICEILPADTPLPGTKEAEAGDVSNPAAAASTGAQGSGPGQRNSAAAMGEAPMGPGPGTQVGDEAEGDEDQEGVLDVASIVAGGKMNEYLAQKEKEKADKAAAKKKGAAGTDTAAAAQSKQVKLPNSKREKAVFQFQDHALLDALKDMNLSGDKMAEAQATLDEGGKKGSTDAAIPDVDAPSTTEATSTTTSGGKPTGLIPRRNIEVGTERFQAASGGILDRLTDAIYRTVSSVEPSNKRGDLWDSLIIVGNGAKVRGWSYLSCTAAQSHTDQFYRLQGGSGRNPDQQIHHFTFFRNNFHIRASLQLVHSSWHRGKYTSATAESNTFLWR